MGQGLNVVIYDTYVGFGGAEAREMAHSWGRWRCGFSFDENATGVMNDFLDLGTFCRRLSHDVYTREDP